MPARPPTWPLFPNTVAVGKAFGVIMMVHRRTQYRGGKLSPRWRLHRPGRHPGDVRPGDEAGDMQRRDFTINALVADPQRSELRDHVGSIADLKSGTLRVVGDAEQRLREDRLRVLRGIRFAARYKLSFAPTTHAALATVRPEQLSRERIWEEWHKALKIPEPFDIGGTYCGNLNSYRTSFHRGKTRTLLN